MELEKQSNFCLGKNVLGLKASWHLKGNYRKPFFQQEQYFQNVSILLNKNGKSRILVFFLPSSVLLASFQELRQSPGIYLHIALQEFTK